MKRREEKKKPTETAGVWRRGSGVSANPTPTNSTPPTPSKPSVLATGTDTSSPPSPAPVLKSRYVPPGQRAAGGTGGWRDREAPTTKPAVGGGSGSASPRPASPAVAPQKEKEVEDGFTTVQPKKWSNSRVGQMERRR